MLRVAVVVGRIALAVASLAGVVDQFQITINGHFSIVNFFSYFTILSNILSSVVFIVSAVRLATRRPAGISGVALRGASVCYMLFVGVVFNTLLTDADLGLLPPWVNVIHHMIMPIGVIVDWLVWPPRQRISIRTALLYLIFPAVYTVYSLVRGAVTGFYPYPFFNPRAVGGYGHVALFCLALIVVFLAIAFLVRWTGNSRLRSVRSTRPGA